MRALSILFGVLLLAGCDREADGDKLKRLTLERDMAHLNVLVAEKNLPKGAIISPSLDSARTRLQLAQRDLNAFMNGR